MKKSMIRSDAALNLDMHAQIFKTLGHPTRLLIMNLIHIWPRHGEEVAEILDVIVQEFEPDRRYTEIEVNRILLEFHEDVATLRRELVGETLMARENGVYWRTRSLA